MKLRNKQTGMIYDSDQITFVIYGGEYGEVEETYLSLTELNDDWEEIKPKEPLIKDERIRKAVQAWAEANNFFNEIEVHSITAGTRFSVGHYDIEFLGYFIYDLEANKTCTIDELCGEEE